MACTMASMAHIHGRIFAQEVSFLLSSDNVSRLEQHRLHNSVSSIKLSESFIPRSIKSLLSQDSVSIHLAICLIIMLPSRLDRLLLVLTIGLPFQLPRN